MVSHRHHAILFVCLGNICRSPLAEGIFRDAVNRRGLSGQFDIDSAGTGAWHTGDPPDARAIVVARDHGIDISGQRARKIASDDFTRFDLILAMDQRNLADLNDSRPPASRAEIHLLLDHATGQTGEVPDPYYGGADGFADVYRTISSACEALLDRLG